jgi:NADH-quinone oxidoreductase subunit H
MVLPWGPGWFGGPNLVLSELNIGILYIAAVTSFTLIGIFMAGWGSNNKYSLIGAIRAGAQLMSYEVPLVLAIIGPVLLAGSLNLTEIVEAQDKYWFIFPQFLAFIVFYIASIAELNRTPFDLSEAESELVAGYFVEYSGIRWGMFMMAEYTNLFTSSLLASVLFFGGWQGPFLPGIVWTLIKAYALVIVAMWIRWTLPRVRIDQLMDLGWKFLIPVSLLNILITGVVVAL